MNSQTLLNRAINTINARRVAKGNKPMGAAWARARRLQRENGGDHEDNVRRANDYLRSKGHAPIGKSLVDMYRAMSVSERTNYGLLLERGFSPEEARALAMSGDFGRVKKSEDAPKSYHQHYVEQASGYLPLDVHQAIHKLARARTGGFAKARATTVNQEAQQEAIEESANLVDELWRKRLKQDAGQVPGSDSKAKEVSKGGPALSEVHVETLVSAPKRQKDKKEASADDLTPPKGVQAACKRGLELAPEYGGPGLTDGAKARARSMAAGKAVSIETVKRMRAFFSRFKSAPQSSSPPSPMYVSWLLWGGDAGFSWSKAQSDRLTQKSTAITKRADSQELADHLLANFKDTDPQDASDACLRAVLKSGNVQFDPEANPLSHDPDFVRLWMAQELVTRMDEALQDTSITVEEARQRASDNLARQTAADGKPKANGFGSGSRTGLRIHLDGGASREPGFLSLDTYPHDFGTVLHDIELGLPAPDGSVDAILATGVAASRPHLANSPVALFQEMQRVLMMGGEVMWCGPDLDEVFWQQFPGLKVVDKQGTDGAFAFKVTRVSAKLPVMYGADVNLMHRQERDAADIAQAGSDFGLQPPPADVAVANLLTKSNQPVEASFDVRVLKKDSWEQIVYGVVLIPEEEDSQGDLISAEEIQKTAHRFLASQMIGHEHLGPMEGSTVVESYIAPQDLHFSGTSDAAQIVPKGAWVLGVHIADEDKWQDVLNGKINGFSVGGFGDRTPLAN